MVKLEHPIKLVSVNLTMMRFAFRKYDSITKEMFDGHRKQVDILLNMLMAPKPTYIIKRFIIDNDSFSNEESLVELIEFVDNIAENDFGISLEDIEDAYYEFAKLSNTRQEASQLYFMNAAEKVSYAYDAFSLFVEKMNEAFEN